MAKKRRRRRRSRPLPPVDPNNRASRKQVVHMDSMNVPNHNRCFDITEVPGTATVASHRFPLMQLVRAENGSGSSIGLAFVDDVYGMTHWLARDIEAPPSWMDPEIFIRMVVTDERVRKICKRYIEANDAGDKNKLRRLISEIFEEVYLVYVFKQFAKVRRLLADWTVAHFAVQMEDEKIRKKSKPRRRS